MTTIRLVSPLGLDQIRDWILANFKENHIDYMESAGGTDYFASRWATKAEESRNHEIELPAHMSRSGRIEYLKPDMYDWKVGDAIQR